MKKRVRRLAAAGLMAVLISAEVFSLSTPKAMAASTGTVNTAALNMRSGASTTTGIIGVLYKGASVTINGTSGSWYKVTATVGGAKKSGYVHSDYINMGGSSINTSVTGQGVVNVNGLNVRSGPSTSSSVIGSVGSGTKVTIKEKLGDWYKVSLNLYGSSKEAYVYAQYVTKTSSSQGSAGSSGTNAGTSSSASSGTGIVNTAALNVRSGPSTSYTRIDCISQGTEVTLLGETNGWYKIKVGGKTGYASAQYITKKSGGSSGGSNSGSSSSSVKNKAGVVNTSALNLREKATTSSSVITCLYSGTKVTIVSSKSGWYKIKTTVGGKDYSGYVASQYITITGNAASSGSSNNSSNNNSGNNSSNTGKKVGTVNTAVLNLRSGPSTGYAVIGSLYSGTTVMILSTSGGWHKVQASNNGKNVTGYVSADYVTVKGNAGGGSTGSGSASGGGSTGSGNANSGSSQKPSSKKTGTVNTSVLNFRSGPSTSASVIGSLSLGMTVIILSESSGWYKVETLYNGKTVTGYVSADYVTVKDGGSNSSSGSTGSGNTGAEVSQDFETMISAFPESYKPALRSLHKKYPEWVFKPINTGLDWNTVIKEESVFRINTTQSSVNSSTNFADLSTASGAYDWSTDKYTVCDGSNWYSASENLIKYYMDPRNFLDERYIFTFESLAYDSAHTKEGVQNILNGTFMKGSYTETEPSTGKKSTRSYSDTFMEAGQISGASPYYLASKARLELGTNGSNSSSGTYYKKPGYYNFFNIGASDGRDAVLNGLNFAAKTDPNFYLPWNTRYKSIVGGAKYIANYFINVGQNTQYTQKFNVVYKDKLYRNQYMTAVHGAASSASTVYDTYKKLGVLDSRFVFYIPVYSNMPSSACARPAYAGNPNAYLKSLQLNSGSVALTPSFKYNKTEYSVIVGSGVSQVTVSASPVSKYAQGVSGTGTYSLKKGQNKITVTCTAGNGNKQSYTINVIRK